MFNVYGTEETEYVTNTGEIAKAVTWDGNIYASKKVSCTANLLNVIEIPLEKGKQVDGFLLNTNGFNVELTNVSFEFIESLSI